jgi:hypothetical protein
MTGPGIGVLVLLCAGRMLGRMTQGWLDWEWELRRPSAIGRNSQQWPLLELELELKMRPRLKMNGRVVLYQRLTSVLRRRRHRRGMVGDAFISYGISVRRLWRRTKDN